jgi:glycosyltransferase involved in cell wall biosynthesis
MIPGPEIDILSLIYGEVDSLIWITISFDSLLPQTQYLLTSEKALSRIKYFIVPSEDQKQMMISKTPITEDKIFVLDYGIMPIDLNIDKFNNVEKIKIIHTVDSDRGLHILLKAMKDVDQNVELNIFNNLYPDTAPAENFYYQIYQDKRINFYGKTPRKIVKKFLSESHIFAYPSIMKEVFSMSLLEGLSAGCICVFRDFGALKTTASGFGQMYEATDDLQEHIKIFSQQLNLAIEYARSKNVDLSEQVSFINEKYSNEKFNNSWSKLNSLI